jgi:hypothetical protein
MIYLSRDGCERSSPTVPRRSILTTLRIACAALGEGLSACRRYQRLTSVGVPHDAAIRDAIGRRESAEPAAPRRAAPLCFAGRA